MMYIGARSSTVEPDKDIGIEYFSSSADEEFKSDQRNNPGDYIYDVIKSFECRDDASNFEIKLHNEFDVGKNPLFYNRAKQTSTGFSTYGKTHSDETRKKLSDAANGKTRSNETRKKMSVAKKNMSDETRKKLSDAKKGKTYSDETRKKMSAAKKGNTHSDETRKKMSDAKNGKTVSDETRKKMSDAKKNMSDETRKKMSDAKKGNTHSDETRKKISDAAKNRSDETRKKLSDTMKGIPKKTAQCPYCLTVCSLPNLSRWHLDNCKLNPQQVTKPVEFENK